MTAAAPTGPGCAAHAAFSMPCPESSVHAPAARESTILTGLVSSARLIGLDSVTPRIFMVCDTRAGGPASEAPLAGGGGQSGPRQGPAAAADSDHCCVPGVGMAAAADVVLACGGDGTIRHVAHVLAGSGTPMGLLPTGTANLLARNLAIARRDPVQATRTALSGKTRAIDVGWVL